MVGVSRDMNVTLLSCVTYLLQEMHTIDNTETVSSNRHGISGLFSFHNEQHGIRIRQERRQTMSQS